MMTGEEQNLPLLSQILKKLQGPLGPHIVKSGQGLVQHQGRIGQAQVAHRQAHRQIDLVHRALGQIQGAVRQHVPLSSGAGVQLLVQRQGAVLAAGESAEKRPCRAV